VDRLARRSPVTAKPAAVVIGAASGIGAACMTALAGSGRYGRLISVDILELPDLEDHLKADLAEESERVRVIDALLAIPEALGALVYCAGIARAVGAGASAWPEWRRILEIDLIAAAQILCGLHERLVGDECAVVTVDSTAADVGSKASPPYAAAKAGLRLLTRSLALRTAGTRTRYNGVAPGPIDTPLGVGFAASLGIEQKTIADRTIAKRLGTPEEVAGAVDFLCSPAASYMNGTVMTVDGGYLAG
jgi:NAD(P)-dependent dehydrogenase (short-subunit alcohol dehydrogenase family)